MVRAVLFDLDDTLYNSTSLSKSARKAALKAMVNEGLDIDLRRGYEMLMRIVKRHGSNYSEHFNRFLEKTVGHVEYERAQELVDRGEISAAIEALEAMQVEYPGTWFDRMASEQLLILRNVQEIR